MVTYSSLIFTFFSHVVTLMLLEKRNHRNLPLVLVTERLLRCVDREENVLADPLKIILSSEDAIPATEAPGYLSATMKLKCYD